MEPNPDEATSRKAMDLPTLLSIKLVRYLVGFGLAVGLGAAPFLGKIAGLGALLDLFPLSLRGSLIPLSIFLMGLIAVVVQFYSGERNRRATLKRRFGVSWKLLLVGLVVLLAFYNLFIVDVPVKSGAATIPVIISSTRLTGGSCKCLPNDGDLQCITRLSVDDAAIATCWNYTSIRFRRFLLSLSYLAVMGGFAALIGLLLLKEALKAEAASAEGHPPPPAPASPHFTS